MIPLSSATRTARSLATAGSRRPAGWNLDSLAGRFVELSSARESATLTLTSTLIREAQLRGEHAAWICGEKDCFYPPDLVASGVDLEQLPVIFVPHPRALPSAADPLVRCGAFALVVMDLGEKAELPLAIQTRLVGLAKHHHTMLLCLTRKSPHAPSLGSLVSLRAEVQRRSLDDGRHACEIRALKDKQQGPGWSHMELRRGPDGLC